MGPSRAGYGWVARASAPRASSGQISLLREGEEVWSWFQAPETTSQAALPTQPVAAQTLLGSLPLLKQQGNMPVMLAWHRTSALQAKQFFVKFFDYHLLLKPCKQEDLKLGSL